MPVPGLNDSHLPMGRWVCTADEAAQAFAPSDSVVRTAIWNDWRSLAAALSQALGEVAACWVSGSFCTDKAQPNDIDCVWIVDANRWSAALNSGDRHVAAFLLTAASQNGNVKSVYGLKVDSFVLEWMPSAGVQRDVSTEPYLSPDPPMG